ncbi:hypothetical protein CH298_02690 [Rhodococcoides fascians]|uniref:hypothetical protein n=1 Tax=Rhodococcoides fascians TaxID=1828 RepID=UPI000B9B00B8|nr:hypothetical protein [Rhodococcus fascians]OZE92460.1 hypothetical protein CH303_02690 [Rhodococcus fascians]OZF23093.1 hypothetical protein CH298_02690 [Rhodococcus fascians]OZF24807.1 hypothetical protein CH297_02690 [Rhodococcus fascians]OZF72402.1 hypothetical protein CH308_02695 [Rhodococcus fascians]OZF73700.1 hypothetical protein CH307_02690 [Rhodococcus fascians]
MSDTDSSASTSTETNSTETADQNAETTTAPTTTPEEQQLGDAGKKAIAAERKARSAAEKELKSAQAELQTLRNASLSDTERAKAEADQYRAEAEQARAEALRFRTATKFGISDEDAELFLTATDEDTLTKQAERLAARAKTEQQQQTRDALTVPGEGTSGAPLALNSNALEEAVKAKLGIV